MREGRLERLRRRRQPQLNSDRLDSCFRDASTAIIDTGPAGLAPAWIDFDELHARRHLQAVAHDSAHDSVKRRVDWPATEMTEHEAGEGPAPDIDRRVP